MPVQETLSEYQAFDGQTGGHIKIKGVTCMVADKDGHLLKYVEDSERGNNEIRFYSTISSLLDFNPLRRFVPKYYGLVHDVREGIMVKYMKIENLLHGLDNPNIVDIKIGRVTHDPFATAEKINREYVKYPAQRDIGFRLSGMKVCNYKTKTCSSYSASLFRSCTCFGGAKNKTSMYLKKFLGLCDNSDKVECSKCCRTLRIVATMNLVKRFIHDLELIIDYMKLQHRIKFYASSLLLAYDSSKMNYVGKCELHRAHVHTPCTVVTSQHTCASQKDDAIITQDLCSVDMRINQDIFLNNKESQSNGMCSTSSRCDQLPYTIRMIDFGHTFIDLDAGSVDDNYLFGIESLLAMFQNILLENYF